jgi:uncharacterized protein YcgI (DUF1989 family)
MVMKQQYEQILPPKTGVAVAVRRGQCLRVTDLDGQQVVDMAVFNRNNPREKLSTSYSRTRYMPAKGGEYVPRDKLMEGDTLMSTLCRPLMTIVKETPEPKGIHDVHHRMCNRYLYESHGFGPPGRLPRDHQPGHGALRDPPRGRAGHDGLFMNYPHDCTRGHWVIKAPVSRPGDYIEFRAEMDRIVALSNRPMDVMAPVNGFRCTPVKVEVYEPD